MTGMSEISDGLTDRFSVYVRKLEVQNDEIEPVLDFPESGCSRCSDGHFEAIAFKIGFDDIGNLFFVLNNKYIPAFHVSILSHHTRCEAVVLLECSYMVYSPVTICQLTTAGRKVRNIVDFSQ